MPCKNGTRKSMDLAKERAAKERELERTCPYRALWRELVDKVYNQRGGFEALSATEKLYYSVNVLSGEVYNGGFDQYFTNTSAEHYRDAEHGLVQLGATNSIKLLRQAKEQLFGSNQVPKSQTERWELIRKLNRPTDLDTLDTDFYKDLDNLDDKLEAFALEAGLVKNA
ncbi:DMP19 family protein [Allohahella marinimesophila]|uniref:DMP19 family protein n=2 Tax=Allohahella marinimesophila TaxID=1054972 RepID=A0ABP7QCI5_9GAMM